VGWGTPSRPSKRSQIRIPKSLRCPNSKHSPDGWGGFALCLWNRAVLHGGTPRHGGSPAPSAGSVVHRTGALTSSVWLPMHPDTFLIKWARRRPLLVPWCIMERGRRGPRVLTCSRTTLFHCRHVAVRERQRPRCTPVCRGSVGRGPRPRGPGAAATLVRCPSGVP